MSRGPMQTWWKRGEPRGGSLLVFLAFAVLAFAVRPVVVASPVLLVPPAMAAAIPARVLVLVALTHPLFANEIDWLAAGPVLAAITPPVLLVRGGHVEVDRLTLDHDTRRGDDYRLGPVERR